MSNSGLSGVVPPHDSDLERAVLGAMLLNNKAFDSVVEIIDKDDFYDTPHACLFQAIIDFKNENSMKAVDLITITEFLKKKDLIDKCGGITYIAELTSSVPTITNSKYYAESIKAFSLRRKVIELSSEMIVEASNEVNDIKDVLDESEQKLSKINSANSSSYYSPAGKYFMNLINEYSSNEKRNNGISTGYANLNSYIGGFRNSEFSIIAARPSVGKTAFALSIVQNMIKEDARVGFFSLEMSAQSLTERMLSMESKVNYSILRNGRMDENTLKRVMNAASMLYEKKLWIQDIPNMKLMDIRTEARRMVKEDHVQIIFIDYIGLIESGLSDNVPRHEQIGRVSRSLKALARELQIPVVVLSQVSRDAEGNEPTLSQLRDSGSIEQDADLVLMLHKDRKYDNLDKSAEAEEEYQRTKKQAVDKIKVIIAKQRNGSVGYTMMSFLSRIVRFEVYQEEV
ncbi:MAG: replicative DNA helicase [Sphaerochaetaceae bacterium]